jgi:hypothetical protein
MPVTQHQRSWTTCSVAEPEIASYADSRRALPSPRGRHRSCHLRRRHFRRSLVGPKVRRGAPRTFVPRHRPRCQRRTDTPWSPAALVCCGGRDRCDESCDGDDHSGGQHDPSDSINTITLLPETSYRLDNYHCAGPAKNSGEKRVIVGPRKTTTKGREEGKRGQLPQA